MADIFNSSRRKLARAEKHIHDFEGSLARFEEGNSHEEFSEPDPENPKNTIHKIRLTNPMPDFLDVIAADAINNLRTALDHAAYALAAIKTPSPKNAAFPFSGSLAEFDRTVNGRCKDIPENIRPFFRTFKPYKGGNDALCALNELYNVDKHALLTPVGTGVVRLHTKASGTGFFSIPNNPVWDRVKNEVVLFTTGPNIESFKYDFEFAFFESFEDVETVRGHPVIRVLHALAGEVDRVLVAIEAEARRIKLIP
jgi:hypothetical protein